MKTSYQLLVLALIMLFGTTAAYDLSLKREYFKVDYKKPYADYDQLNFKDFDKIEIIASNLLATTIIYGDKFDVKQFKQNKDAHVEQKGSTLIITFNANSRSSYAGSENDFIIKCPSLKQIIADAEFTVKGDTMIARQDHIGKYSGGRIFISGFKQDSLSVIMNNFSKIFLKHNRINVLVANIGSSDSSRSTIDVDGTNQISSVALNLQHQSIINLRDIDIKNFKNKLSDSAEVNLSGISLRLLSNKN